MAAVVTIAVTAALLVPGGPSTGATAATTASCNPPPAGAALAWGANTSDKLGDGTNIDRPAPGEVTGLDLGSEVTQVAAGSDHSLALTADGSVWAWGENAIGQLGNGTTREPWTSLFDGVTAAGSPTLASANATFTATDIGRLVTGVGIPFGARIVAVADQHTVTLSADATERAARTEIRVWAARPAVKVALPGPATAVAAGDSHSLAVVGGSVWAWGHNDHADLGVPSNAVSSSTPLQVMGADGMPLTGVSAVAAGSQHSVALKSDGTVWAWGTDSYGQLGDGQSSNVAEPVPVQVKGAVGQAPAGATAIAAGASHSLAVGSDGTVWGWGDNSFGQLGDGHKTRFEATPVEVVGLPAVGAVVSTNQVHSLAVDRSGNVWAWGSGDRLGGPFTVTDGVTTTGSMTVTSASAAFSAGDVGRFVSGGGFPDGTTLAQVDDPTTAVLSVPASRSGSRVSLTFAAINGSSPVPVQVRALAGVTAVAAGVSHSLARLADGSAWGWGDNSSGQLGMDPSVTSHPAPVPIPGADHITKVAAGANNSLAIRTSGTAFVIACAAVSPQQATIGTAFGQPLAVQVRNPAGGPMTGISVTFTAPATGAGGIFAGGVTSTVATSDADGVATASDFTANTTVGAYTVTATAAGYEAAAIYLTNNVGPPASVTALAGTTPQQTRVTTAFPQSLAVRVADRGGNPVQADVTFTVQAAAGGAGGAFNGGADSAAAHTDSTGLATAPFLVADATAGQFDVTATAAGVDAPAVFVLTNTANPIPASITVSAGDNQSAEVGKGFATRLETLVLDAKGLPALGAQVAFAFRPGAGGAGAAFAGGATSTTVISGYDGVAAADPLTAGAIPGAYMVQASVAGVVNAAVFHLTNTPQPPPVITGLAPSGGPAWGGSEVTITGTGFSGLSQVATVAFGGAGVHFQVTSDTTIVAVSPAGIVGRPVAVTVALADSTLSAPTNADRFWYFAGGWRPAGVLGRPRASPSASLLDSAPCHTTTPSPAWCGTVLVVGGEGQAGTPCAQEPPSPNRPASLLSTEVYDPTSAHASDTGHMHFGRVDHSATVLADGRVLVAGGCSNGAALAATEIYDPAQGTWTPAAALHEARFGHSATALTDGTVLVVGGQGSDKSALDSAEIFEPAAISPGRTVTDATVKPGIRTVTSPSAAFSSADIGRVVTGDGITDGTMVAAVVNATTITLSDADTVERLGAATITLGSLLGRWTETALPGRARSGHTATRLDGTACHPATGMAPAWCGRVLVAGGASSSWQGSASYEIYDPATGWRQPSDTMTAPRYGHSATLLPDGTVLVAGGCCSTTAPPGVLASAEIYDPAAGNGVGAWKATAPMADARQDHSATLSDDGTVMVVGGSTDIGGGMGAGLSSTEIYQHGASPPSWAARGDLIQPRRTHAVVALSGGQVLVVGGTGIRDQDYKLALASVEAFDFGATQPAPVLTGLDPVVAPAAGGTEVTITGAGFYSDAAAGTVVHFGDVSAQPTWLGDDKIVVKAPGHPPGTVNVTVTRPGAVDSAPTPAGRFTYTASSWAPTGPLDGCQPTDPSCTARTRHSATLLAGPACQPAAMAARAVPWCGKVLVAGGSSIHGATRTAELYDPGSGTWEPTGPMSHARMDHSATLLPDGRVLVAGGYILDSLSITHALRSAELYDPARGSWETVGDLHDARLDHSATLLGDGTVLVAGGAVDADAYRPVAGAEIYHPTAKAWTPTARLDGCAPDPACVARAGHSATLLPTGIVLVVGGLGIQVAATDNVTSGGVDPVHSAETYDPSTRSWSATDGLPSGEERAYHSATLLTDGRVLVAGGIGGIRAGRTAWLTRLRPSSTAAPGSTTPTPHPTLPSGSPQRP